MKHLRRAAPICLGLSVSMILAAGCSKVGRADSESPAKIRTGLRSGFSNAGWNLDRYPELEPPYQGQPYMVDEFGGIKWIPTDKKPYMDTSWGYGDAPKTEEEFFERLEGLVDAVLAHPHICGFCYTQLTDVEQEQNGIYNYDRTEKFDMSRIAAIFRKPAGSE